MREKGYSISKGKNGKKEYPIEKVIGYSKDRRSFTIQLKLKPAQEYEMVLTGRGFRSWDGYPLKNYLISFKTK